MNVREQLFLLLLCCYAVRSRSCLLLSFLLWKKKNCKWILSPCCSGKLSILVMRHQPCMILGFLIFNLYHFKKRKTPVGNLMVCNPSYSEEVITFFFFVLSCSWFLSHVGRIFCELFFFYFSFFFFSLKRSSSSTRQEGLQKTGLLNIHYFHQPFIIPIRLFAASYIFFLNSLTNSTKIILGKKVWRNESFFEMP